MAADPPEVTQAIARAAVASDEDKERMRLAWRRDAPPFFKFLLDALPWDPTTDPNTGG